ncbi:hypothetical protein D3C84_1003300 [compost metagenome]
MAGIMPFSSHWLSWAVLVPNAFAARAKAPGTRWPSCRTSSWVCTLPLLTICSRASSRPFTWSGARCRVVAAADTPSNTPWICLPSSGDSFAAATRRA